MTFEEMLTQVQELLQRDGRVAYRILKRHFALTDDDLEDLKADLIDAKRLAIDEEGKVLVWTGASPVSSSEFQVPSSTPPPTPNTQLPAAERRQLTVMFCDLVGSTALSTQLDPEELREVIQAYRETCATVIRRFDGHLAKYIGDGLLVYFGYPLAHEDDAQRAVRVGLEIVRAIQDLPLQHLRLSHPLQVRIGIHTGLVVAGEMGTEDQPEPLAIVGETPNLAARLQDKAEPNSVVISPATLQLVTGMFECQALGPQLLKGISTPLEVYQVVAESAAQSRFEAAVQTGLTPLVGREEELHLLHSRWAQVQDGNGQVVLLSGEPGIGKSRLVQEFKEQLGHEGVTRIEFRCSPYHQNSALYPIIDHLQRLLQFAREDSPAAKLEKLQHTLSHYHFPQAETVPLLASLLSLPHLEGYPPITGSPQKQKEKTQAVLVAWLVEEAEKAAVHCTWEDLHWTDPSTLEVLNLVVDQAPTARLYVLLTFRPEFTPPWGNRSHVSQLTLNRLSRAQVREMVSHVVEQALPDNLIDAVVARTDGVPLFVEELTKSVVESGGATGRSSPMAIPATLHDSLMARLDRLEAAKEIAQLGATIGREFSYELLQAVSLLDEARLQHGLKQLVTAELVYQRGLGPQAHYLFKHALIQDTAYQSLLKSKRQQLHQRIAQVLEERFPETVETHPELLAHHYTEAGLVAQALPYWQLAGERATQRSAYVEAVAHLTKGLELLKTLPDTPERAQQELTLQTTLGVTLLATKGYTAPEVEKAYNRARELCQQVGETPQLFPVLWGLWAFYTGRAEHREGYELAQQCLTLAQRVQDAGFLLESDVALGTTLLWRGELVPSRTYLEHGVTLYDPEQYRSHTFLYGQDPGVWCCCFLVIDLWTLGYPDQALKRSQEALVLAQKLTHHHTLALALTFSALAYLLRGEWQLAQERAEKVLTVAAEQGFPYWSAEGTFAQGSALVGQGQVKEGIERQRQNIATLQAIGTGLNRPGRLTELAAAYGKVGQIEEGLALLAEALALVDKTEGCFPEAEVYRVKGELLLQEQSGVRSPESQEENQKSKGKSQKLKMTDLRPLTSNSQAEAEECFLKAIEVARKQQAKSLELRAVTSLARLWQQQNKKAEAHKLLAEVYNWFTEGFDTKDLQEAKTLIEELRN